MQSVPEAMNKDVSGSGSSSGSVRQAFGFDGKNGESPAASQGQRNEVLHLLQEYKERVATSVSAAIEGQQMILVAELLKLLNPCHQESEGVSNPATHETVHVNHVVRGRRKTIARRRKPSGSDRPDMRTMDDGVNSLVNVENTGNFSRPNKSSDKISIPPCYDCRPTAMKCTTK